MRALFVLGATLLAHLHSLRAMKNTRVAMSTSERS